MSWADALWWLPTLAALVMTAAALFAAAAQPPRPAKTAWLAGLVILGILAVALSAWQQAASRTALGEEAARLREIGERLDQVGRLAGGGPGATPAETFDTVAAAIAALNGKVKDLETQIDLLKQKMRGRVLSRDAAEKMAEYLRQFGTHRVVVSCAPDDVEAFDYANQIANVLRDAGWEALGPEKTTIFGEAPAMAVRLYAHPGTAAPDAARILLEAFGRFNIPYQSGVAPSDAIPDPATVELFVSHKS